MQFSGDVDIRAPREKVFAFLIDPNQVGSCGPGVESIEVIDDTHFRARAKVGVGFISARFTIDLDLAEARAPDRAVIKAHGQAPGSAVDALGTMNLLDGDEPNTTQMLWAADVQISGMIASVGARLVNSTADKLIKQTFDCIKAKLEA
jgi:carbon monoxide dehydrogenase subunit G